ncbi:MAG: hypothetical protein ABWZ25_00705 [Chitinophagaceae bacterium]
MKEEILSNLDNPVQLEKLYRTDKPAFKRVFKSLYPGLEQSPLARFWFERLNFTSDEITWGTRKDLLFVIFLSLLAGLLAKLPDILHLDREAYLTRNIGFMTLSMLTVYFSWKNRLSAYGIAFVIIATLLGLFFINFFPDLNQSDTLILSCIHLPLFLWCILGFSFTGDHRNTGDKRLDFLRYNGDLVVITALILIAGAILSGLTIGLFSLIGFNIEKFYSNNIIMFALPIAPIIGTYLVRNNPQLVGKVSPVIARIFSPLVMVMLVIYLIAIVYSGKNPYNDREFLLLFNALLIGVMAIIFFSLAESSKSTTSKTATWLLLLLPVVTVIVNGIALSAILFRISEWGITPNRAAVLGGNILIFINLLLVIARLFRVLTNKSENTAVGNIISSYLPVYFVWTIIVTFLFPFFFGFR